MTAALLREFMPYGAPDLQAAARPHLVRALVLGSFLVTLLFALAWSWSMIGPRPRVPRAVVVAPFVVTSDMRVLEPPPPPLAPTPIARPRLAKAIDGPPVPVQDTPESIDRTIAEQGEVRGGPPTAGETHDRALSVPPPDTPINGPGDFVFVDELPSVVRPVRPEYNELAKLAQVDGLVIVDVLVGKDGRVLEARLDPKHSIPLLDADALDAARQWIFTPALSNNHPVLVWVRLPFRFTLQVAE